MNGHLEFLSLKGLIEDARKRGLIICYRTVRNWIDRGQHVGDDRYVKLPATYFGRRLYIRRSDWETFLTRTVVEANKQYDHDCERTRLVSAVAGQKEND